MNSFLRFSIKPYGIIALTIFVSFLMWLFPDFSGHVRKGFNKMLDPSATGILICALWIFVILIFSYAGYIIGSRIKINTTLIDKRVSLDFIRPYLLLSLCAYIGIFALLGTLLSNLGLAGIIHVIAIGQANTLKDTLYDSYSIGIVSLRYMAIPACALAVYHFSNRRFYILNILNILSLAFIAIVSSRLSIIFTAFTLLPIVLFKMNIKIKPRQSIIFIVIMFHILAALNYSRNISFYRYIGIDNFYLAAFSEIITYLGSPFQGFLAAGTFHDFLFGLSYDESSIYTGISKELSTNSALLELTRNFGSFQAFVIIAMFTFFGAIIMAVARKNQNNLLILLFGSVGYCFAEIWRVFLFGQGIVYTIAIVVIAISIWCMYIPSVKNSLTVTRYGKNYDHL
jgi:hypothetical protein